MPTSRAFVAVAIAVLLVVLFRARCGAAPPGPAPTPIPPITSPGTPVSRALPGPIAPAPAPAPSPYVIPYPPGTLPPRPLSTLPTLVSGGDTDGDGLSDMDEIQRGTDPNNPDTDGDGLRDGDEVRVHGTNPANRDTDGDLLPDGLEVRGLAQGLDPLSPNNINADTDGDGLSDIDELRYNTDLLTADTDGDGVNDGDEVARGADPTDPSDRGVAPSPDELVEMQLTVGDPSGSHSERYNLDVGPISHQAPQFGVVASARYKFKRGKKYPITLVHTGTDPAFFAQHGFSNYDWYAQVQPVSANACVWVEDPQNLLIQYIDWPNSTFLAAGRVAWLHVYKIDLDIDSDNDNGFANPDRNDAEEKIEDAVGDPTKPGKIIAVGGGDFDRDGIADLADGYDFDGADPRDDVIGPDPAGATLRFARLVIELEDPIDLTKAKVKVSYPASDPAAVRRRGRGTLAEPYVYTPGPGHLRIWRKDAAARRDERNASAGGDFVGSGVVYDPAQLGSGRKITLFVEAVAPSRGIAEELIHLEVDPNGPADPPAFECGDEVRAVAVRVDLDVNTDRDGDVDDDDDIGEDGWVKERGALYMVNYDDDDGPAVARKPDAIGFDDMSRPIDEDNDIDGGTDRDDIAPLIARPTGPQAGLQFFLNMAAPDLKAVHIFEDRTNAASGLLKRAGADWSGWAARGAATEVEVTAHVQAAADRDFGIEGLFLAGQHHADPAGGNYTFDGEVEVELVAQTTVGAPGIVRAKVVGTDTVKLKVAPLLLLPNTHRVLELFMQASPGTVDIARKAGAVAQPRASGDEWFQDHVQICFTAMPGMEHRVAIRLPRRGWPAWPESSLFADGRGLLGIYDGIQHGAVLRPVGGEFGGNLEVVPPSKDWPLGRVVHGNTMRVVPPSVPALLGAQKLAGAAIQSPFVIDTMWLFVGHVDEVVSFVGPDPGWKVVEADPALAKDLLSGGITPATGTAIAAPPRDAAFFATGDTAAGRASNAVATSDGFYLFDGVAHGRIACTGAAAAPSGRIVAVAKAALGDGQTVTIDDGSGPRTFELDLAGGVAAGNVAVDLTAAAAVGADDVRDRIVAAIAGARMCIDAVADGAGALRLRSRVAGTRGNIAILETVTAAAFTVTGMAGGDASGVQDGESVTIDDGTGRRTFEFETCGGVAATATAVPVRPSDGADAVRASLRAAIRGIGGFKLRVEDDGTAALLLIHEDFGDTNNRPIVETVAAGAFAVAGLDGGEPAADGRDFTRAAAATPWEWVRLCDGAAAGQIGRIQARGRGWLHVHRVATNTVVDVPWVVEDTTLAGATNRSVHGLVFTGGAAVQRPRFVREPARGTTYIVADGSKMWLEGFVELPGVHSVGELLAEPSLWALNGAAKARIMGAATAIAGAMGEAAPRVPFLKDDASNDDDALVGDADDDFISVPVIYMGRWTGRLEDRNNLAYTPGLANFQQIAPGGPIVLPKPFAPKDAAGDDLFEKVATMRLGAGVVFADDWNLFHRRQGEVHCATADLRDRFANPWWEKQP